MANKYKIKCGSFSLRNILEVEKQDYDFEELANDICIGLYGVSLEESVEILDVVNRNTKQVVSTFCSHKMFSEPIPETATLRQVAINVVRQFEDSYRKVTPKEIFLVDKTKEVVYNNSITFKR